jgi:hypothetical protein
VSLGTSPVVFSKQTGSATIIPGTIAFNDVTFLGLNTAFSLGGGTMTVNGTLNIGDINAAGRAINSGTLMAYGNVNYTNNGELGTAAITFAGSSAATLNIAATATTMTGLVTVNKTGGGSLA